MTSAQPVVESDFDAFYQANFRDTVTIVFGYTADMAAAQDITQEAFVRAWQRWQQISRYDNPVYWVRRVAENLAHSRWRRAKVAAAYLMRQRPASLPEISSDSVDVVNALKQLPATQRKAIVLHYLMDYSVAQVAQEMEVPAGTVKSWLSRGRSSLSVTLRTEVDRAVKPQPSAHVRATATRRQVRKRAGLAAVVAFILAVVLSVLQIGGSRPPEPPATPSPSTGTGAGSFGNMVDTCSVAPLPVPAGSTGSWVNAGDAEFLAGWAANDRGGSQVLIWEKGKLSNVLPVADAEINVSGVSGSDGVVVGNTNQNAWATTGSAIVTLDGNNTVAHGIGPQGIIAGSERGQPVVWSSFDSPYRSLPMPLDASFGYAIDVTADGTIVGVVSANPITSNSRDLRSFTWYPDGSMRELTPPAPFAPSSRAFAANGQHVIGLAGNAESGTGIVRWLLGTQEAVQVPEWAETVGSNGDYVGGGKLSTAGNVVALPLQLPDGDSVSEPRMSYFDRSDVISLAGSGVSKRTGKSVAIEWKCSTTYRAVSPGTAVRTAPTR